MKVLYFFSQEVGLEYCPFFLMLGQLAPQLEVTPPTPPLLTPPTPPPLTPPAPSPLTPPTPPPLTPPTPPPLTPPTPPPLTSPTPLTPTAQPLSLEEEIKQFEEKYAGLVVQVRDAFKRGRVSFEQVQSCLLQLPVSLTSQCGKFLQSQASDLFQATSIDVLFVILSQHWNFLNPNLLAHLVQRFGDRETKDSVDKYLGDLRKFRMRTKIGDFIDKWSGTPLPGTKEIVMELEDNWGEQSLQQLEELRIKVSRKRCLEDYVMPLKRIKASSVDAVFSLPESVDVHSLELESLQEFFQEYQVLRILLNGVCILNLQVQQVCPLVCVLCTFCVPFSSKGGK